MKSINILITVIFISLHLYGQDTEYFTSNSGSFSVTGSDYGDEMYRVYDITIGVGSRIELTINNDLEEGYDQLQIIEPNVNGTSGSVVAEIIDIYGEHQYVSAGNHISIIFTSDCCVSFDSGYNGFTVDYTITAEPPTYSSILASSTVISGHSDKPNLIVEEPNYKSMYSSSGNNRANFDNSTLLVKTGNNQLGLGSNTIASSSSLYLKSAYSMYFNSSGYYYFGSPNTNDYTGKVDVSGELWLKNNIYGLRKIYGMDHWVKSYDDNVYVRDIHRSIRYGGTRYSASTAPANSWIWSHEWGTSYKFELGAETVKMRGEASTGKWQWAIRKDSYGGTELLSVNNEGSGRVGINNNNPSEALDVNGNIVTNGTINANEILVKDMSASNLMLDGNLFADKIMVKTNGQTADFVFSDTYQLKDLSEVENYILTYKHLPDIPSATQMEEQGVDLAEMNKLLLQKIEELTLYAIQQDGEIRELRKGNIEKEKERKELEQEICMVREELKAIKALIIKNQKYAD
ncbi:MULTISPECIES: hypothetical protein [unclassified Saccharicrinis]|uniref:hypothetical protein n=1 Tax=unclassified Saccharicrinis TaxID=2646859 RepID=UPI003D34C4A0